MVGRAFLPLVFALAVPHKQERPTRHSTRPLLSEMKGAGTLEFRGNTSDPAR